MPFARSPPAVETEAHIQAQYVAFAQLLLGSKGECITIQATISNTDTNTPNPVKAQHDKQMPTHAQYHLPPITNAAKHPKIQLQQHDRT